MGVEGRQAGSKGYPVLIEALTVASEDTDLRNMSLLLGLLVSVVIVFDLRI